MNENQITQVTNEQMIALKALADTNMKVSEVKATLIKIEETKQEYFKIREEETIKRINKIISESSKILKEAQLNYYETTQFHHTTASYADALATAHSILLQNVSDFDKRQVLWEKSMKEQEDILNEIKKGIVIENVRILNDKKGIERAQKKIEQDKVLIESRQAQIKSALAVLDKKKNG